MHAKPIAAALLVLGFLVAAGTAQASVVTCTQPPKPAPSVTCYDIVTADPGQPPALGLNDDLVVQFESALPDNAAAAVLSIDGSPLGVPPRVDQSRRQLTFPLQRTADEKNRAMWSRLLGRPFSHEIEWLPISLAIPGKPVQFSASDPAISAAPSEAIRLVTFKPASMAFGLVLAAVVVVATVLMCMGTTMTRDASIPQLRLKDRPFSLGRLQMTFWFCLIFASVVFIGVVTYDINSISPQSFVLLGVSAATALGSIAVDQTKDSPVAQVQSNVAALGIATAAQVDALAKAVEANPAAAANSVIPNAAIGTNYAPTVGQLWDEYQSRIGPVRSDGFFRDLVNDVNGPTIHRWQMLIWTLLLGGVYVVHVYTNLETPQFDANLLALMGISGATYIGFKIPEKQPT